MVTAEQPTAEILAELVEQAAVALARDGPRRAAVRRGMTQLATGRGGTR